MKLKLIRDIFTENSTTGKLFVEDKFECYVLEDKIRKEKIKGKTAIPEGTYQVIINFSQRFQRMMPLLLNVPGFEGIRIHSGNSEVDTSGCLLVGTERVIDRLIDSRDAYEKLFAKLANAKDDIFIEITSRKDTENVSDKRPHK